MNFDLSDELRLLRDSVERLMSDWYTFDHRRSYQEANAGYSEAMWARYAELGLLALPFAEKHGGFGGGPIEIMTVMEAFGKALILDPYFATVVLAGGVLRHGASEEQKVEIIPQIADGRMKLAFAYAEPQSRYDLFNVETKAIRDADGWTLNGAKGLVLHGDAADKIVVTARTAGDTRDTDGIGLFLVDAKAPGLACRGYATQDGLRAAEITFQNVRVRPAQVIGDPAGSFPIISRVADEAVAALCAEAVGCFGKMQTITVDYLKTREQFGRKIGTFQVLQHGAVDILVESEQSRSMAIYAAMMASECDATERERAVSAAKIQIGRSAKVIGHKSIQLHGAIGMTMQYSIGHYFKRVAMIDTMFGDADHHLRRLAALGGLIDRQSIELESSTSGKADHAAIDR
ncbi:MAG: pimeloyl-CoA dehydrogenase small subunit [Mesorhizobium sp.]|uniref:acyl-CoA dehydrogenase family protein n=1 Tax=Mesorhizobium sp. TaxID=1871066 RepID=UPI00122AB02B|nr:acyl-CoA dehydrogenase [Mesorhizobium sp.]TIN32411.1 MAG: pimeloyl-CoA dehydrogenase small subunit [Mesorhizobium sp.]TJU83303.1 MAG: pimeloyl-CoA dehydrogenase small subunit [Mesorhizobium sp.]